MKRNIILTVVALIGVSLFVVNAQFSRDFTDEFVNSASGAGVYANLRRPQKQLSKRC